MGGSADGGFTVSERRPAYPLATASLSWRGRHIRNRHRALEAASQRGAPRDTSAGGAAAASTPEARAPQPLEPGAQVTHAPATCEPAPPLARPLPSPRMARCAAHKHRRAWFRTSTAHLWATTALVAVTLVAFAADRIARHGDGTNIPWGANVGMLTWSGEWWRIPTSMFAHVDLLHLAGNMGCLALLGAVGAERLVGNLGLLACYLASGLVSAVVGVIATPLAALLGASGAVYGIAGLLCALLARDVRRLTAAGFGSPLVAVAVLVALDVLGTAITPDRISLGAHLSGFAVGALAGLVLAPNLDARRKRGRPLRAGIVALGGLVVTVVLVLGFPNPAAPAYARLDRARSVSAQCLARYADLYERWTDGGVDGRSFATELRGTVVGPWRDARLALADIEPVPPALDSWVTQSTHYMLLQEQAWDLAAQSMDLGDQAAADGALELQTDAQAVATELARAVQTELSLRRVQW